ncbi:MAG: non-homologous end-joining DNA ligase [Actinomycetota bacterium]|nr:non-homologous end-joining DNA ligase [Actinomycetota bacterium]
MSATEQQEVRLSSLGRVLWPEAGFTKADLVAYYTAVAPALLGHVAGRPLTLARFPEGVDRAGWYQTNWRVRPGWLATALLGTQEYGIVNELRSLLWVANVGGIELHPLAARAERIDEPTHVVFDLDPGAPADLLDCCRVAVRLRERLAELRLAAFVKTSGSLGLHVYVPLSRGHTYRETKGFARAVALELAEADARRVVAKTARSLRAGKVLVDWVQNDARKSTVAAYSPRALRRPTVSTPLAWEEVEAALAAGDPARLVFEPARVVERLDRTGDLFRPVLEVAQTLPVTG